MPPRLSEAKYVKHFWERVNIKSPNECWEWKEGKTSDGYGSVSFNSKSHLSHRVAWILTNGPIPDKMFVCHSCDNRLCVNPKHLFIGSNDDNMRDMVVKCRSADQKGEKNGHAKLKKRDILKIRELYSRGDTSQQKIADIFGVTQGSVSHIIRKTQWRNVL